MGEFEESKGMETVLNRFRIRVRKWCASCEHKEVDKEGNRICTGMQLKVPKDFVCPKWHLSDGLNNAGRPPVWSYKKL